MKKIRENFSSFEDVWFFTQILFLVTILPVMLRLFSLPKLMKMFTPRDLKVYKNLDLEKIKYKVVKFTDYILSRKFFICKNTCLIRTLILYYLLRKSEINVHICLGVKYNGKLSISETQKKLAGHAWLLYNGDIFLERNAEVTKNFKMTYCFPERKEQVGKKNLKPLLRV